MKNEEKYAEEIGVIKKLLNDFVKESDDFKAMHPNTSDDEMYYAVKEMFLMIILTNSFIKSLKLVQKEMFDLQMKS
jgi:hypothetical protein